MKNIILILGILLSTMQLYAQCWSLGVRTGANFSLNMQHIPEDYEMKAKHGSIGPEFGLYAYRLLKNKAGIYFESGFECRNDKVSFWSYPKGVHQLKHSLLAFRIAGDYLLSNRIHAQAGFAFAAHLKNESYVYPDEINFDFYNSYMNSSYKDPELSSHASAFAEVGAWYATKWGMGIGARYSYGFVTVKHTYDLKLAEHPLRLGGVSLFVTMQLAKACKKQ